MGGIASAGVEAYAKAVVRYVRAPLTEDREDCRASGKVFRWRRGGGRSGCWPGSCLEGREPV